MPCMHSAQAMFAPNFRYPSWIEPTINRTDSNFRGTFANSLAAGQYSDQYQILSNTSIPVVLFAGDLDVRVHDAASAAPSPLYATY